MLKLVDFDVATGTKHVTILNDLVDYLVLSGELLVKMLNFEGLDGLMQVSQGIKEITMVV